MTFQFAVVQCNCVLLKLKRGREACACSVSGAQMLAFFLWNAAAYFSFHGHCTKVLRTSHLWLCCDTPWQSTKKLIWWKLFDTQSSNTELKPGPERKIGIQFQNPSSQTRRTSFATPFQAISPQFSGSTGPLYNMFPVFNFLTKKYITWSKRVAGEDVWTSGRHWQDHQTSTKHGNAVTASGKNSKQQHQRLKNDYDQSKSVFWFESLQASWNI